MELSRQAEQAEALGAKLDSSSASEQRQREAVTELEAAAEAARESYEASAAAAELLRTELAVAHAGESAARQICEDLQIRLEESSEVRAAVLSLQSDVDSARNDLEGALLEAEATRVLRGEQEAQLRGAHEREQALVIDCGQLRVQLLEAEGAKEALLQKASAVSDSRLAAAEQTAADAAREVNIQLEDARGETASVQAALEEVSETAEAWQVPPSLHSPESLGGARMLGITW